MKGRLLIVPLADPLKGEHGNNAVAQAPNPMMRHRFKVHHTGSACFDGLGASALEQASGGWRVPVCVGRFGDLNMRVVIMGFILATVLMHQAIEGIPADTSQLPGRAHSRVRPAQGHGVGM